MLLVADTTHVVIETWVRVKTCHFIATGFVYEYWHQPNTPKAEEVARGNLAFNRRKRRKLRAH